MEGRREGGRDIVWRREERKKECGQESRSLGWWEGCGR